MSFAFYRSLTIDHTKCGGSDSSSFPVLVFASDASLKDAAHGGHVQSSAGADMLFFADSGGVTQYASEIDFYDNVNGILWAWVQVNVSHSTNTTFYVLYGNASPPSRTTNPWDANFQAVWHLGNSLSLNDSTANGNTLSNSGFTATTAQIDGGGISNGTSNFYLLSGSPAGLLNLNNLTFSGWINPSAWTNPASAAQMYIFASAQRNFMLNSNGTLKAQMQTSSSFRMSTSTNTVTIGSWAHVVAVFSSVSNMWKIYLNGTEVAYSSQTAGSGSNSVDSGGFALGAAETNLFVFNFNGGFDEMRVSNIVRGIDWITTEYNNQNAPGNIGSPGFLTWGSEQLSLLAEDKITPGSITSRIETGDIHFGGM